MTPQKVMMANVICAIALGILCLVMVSQIPYIYSAPIRNDVSLDTAAPKTVVSRSIPAELDLPRPEDETLVFYDTNEPDLDSSKFSSMLYTDRDTSYRTLSYSIRLTPDNILADRSEMNQFNAAFANYEVFAQDIMLPLTQYAYANAISGIEEAICSYVGATNDQVMLYVTLIYSDTTDLAPTYIGIQAESVASDKLSLSCFVHDYVPGGIVDYKTKQWIRRPDYMRSDIDG